MKFQTALILLLALRTSQAQEGQVHRASVSKHPDDQTNKGKIQRMQTYVPVRLANGTGASNPTSGKCDVGVNIGGICKVHPLIVSYMEQETKDDNAGVPPEVSFDAHAAVSMDDGRTWKTTNLSKSADKVIRVNRRGHDDNDHDDHRRSLHEDGDGDGTTDSFEYLGDIGKPTLVVNGKYVLVAYTSKYCKTGNPSNIQDDEIDRFKVMGSQRYATYEAGGKLSGEVPYSCVWSARGVIGPDPEDPDKMSLNWMKPQQHTSGRRDAYQLVAAVTGKAGFAMAWQEDPKGLRPGEAEGPGDGYSGATVSKKTDIWFTFLHTSKFPQTLTTDGIPAIKPAHNFSSPIPLTDNAACKAEPTDIAAEIDKEFNGVTYNIKGAPYCKEDEYCTRLSAPEEHDKGYQFCVTEGGVTLSGKSGASRVNMFLQPKQLPNGKYTAEVIIGYEQSKGLGFGPDGDEGENKDEDKEDEGKNVHYMHLPDASKAHPINSGTILNLPEVAKNGKPLVSSDGQLLRENARRVRLIVQPKSKKGKSGVVLVALWRQGRDGHGKPAQIMSRLVYNGYEASNFECTQRRYIPGTQGSPQKRVCTKGVKNLSGSTPIIKEYETNADGSLVLSEEDGKPIPKVVTSSWSPKNLLDATSDNPYSDARAHRGFLRGDNVVIGFTYTDKWGRANNKYDFYVRRSFDGGRTMTNHAGKFEEPKNLSHIREPGHKGHSVTEPRIYGTPGDILQKNGKAVTKGDVQNLMTFAVAYGTTKNPHQDSDQDGDGVRDLGGEDDHDSNQPEFEELNDQIYYSYTDNYGESFHEVYNEKSQVWGFDKLTKGMDDIENGEAQIRMNPAGSQIFASYKALGEGKGPCVPGGDGGSDLCFRKEPYIYGDIDPFRRYDLNGDGVVDAKDIKSALREFGRGAFDENRNNYVYYKGTLKERYEVLDLNDDGKVTLADKNLLISAIDEYAKQVTKVDSIRRHRRRNLRHHD